MFKKVLGFVSSEDPSIGLTKKLQQTGVPFVPLDGACVACVAPCDLGAYPSMHIDETSNMLGRVRPFSRQIIISTGKTDWTKDITDVSGVAKYVQDAQDDFGSRGRSDDGETPWRGFIDTPSAKSLTVLNGSHRTSSDDAGCHTVVVLPDFTFVNEVPATRKGGDAFWKTYADPRLQRGGDLSGQGASGSFQSWPLPYDVVILLCSHKRRDTRCGVSAPILEEALVNVLHDRTWEVHTEIDADLSEATNENEPNQLYDKLTHSNKDKKALLLKTSHVGGHKFAGNVLVYSRTGRGVWYGRVKPEHIPAIVDETIINGKIIPELLRGGMNIEREGGKCMHDW